MFWCSVSVSVFFSFSRPFLERYTTFCSRKLLNNAHHQGLVPKSVQLLQRRLEGIRKIKKTVGTGSTNYQSALQQKSSFKLFKGLFASLWNIYYFFILNFFFLLFYHSSKTVKIELLSDFWLVVSVFSELFSEALSLSHTCLTFPHWLLLIFLCRIF